MDCRIRTGSYAGIAGGNSCGGNMTCCNQDCNQGRNCPKENDPFSDRLAWALTVFIIALVMFIAVN
jgi:hypothetical protein